MCASGAMTEWLGYTICIEKRENDLAVCDKIMGIGALSVRDGWDEHPITIGLRWVLDKTRAIEGKCKKFHVPEVFAL